MTDCSLAAGGGGRQAAGVVGAGRSCAPIHPPPTHPHSPLLGSCARRRRTPSAPSSRCAPGGLAVSHSARGWGRPAAGVCAPRAARPRAARASAAARRSPPAPAFARVPGRPPPPQEKAQAQAFANALATIGKFVLKKKTGDKDQLFAT